MSPSNTSAPGAPGPPTPRPTLATSPGESPTGPASVVGWPEAGWVLSPWAHGQGFAREAADAILGWADSVLKAERTVCLIDPDNAPSLALAARLGFEAFAESRYKGRNSILLERVRPQRRRLERRRPRR